MKESTTNTNTASRKTYTFFNPWTSEEETVWLTRTTYINNGTLAVQMWCDEGPYDTITVNLADSDQWKGTNFQYVDTNNNPWVAEWLEDNGIATNTGIIGRSGWCEYPLFNFNTDLIPESKH